MPSLLPHSLSCIPGRVRVNNPPNTGAAAWDTAAASFPSLSRPGLGTDRPGSKPKIGRAVWDCLTLLVLCTHNSKEGDTEKAFLAAWRAVVGQEGYMSRHRAYVGLHGI